MFCIFPHWTITLPAAVPDPPPWVPLFFAPFLLAEPASRTQTFLKKYFHFQEKIKTIQVQFLPETANENCADSHEEDHHQRHVEALLLVCRAAEKIISTST